MWDNIYIPFLASVDSSFIPDIRAIPLRNPRLSDQDMAFSVA